MTQEPTHDVREDEVHDHDRGLSFDVSTLMTRRRALQLLAIGGLATVVGCGTSYGGSAATTGATAEIPEETGGPFPGDGSNGVERAHRERHRAQRHHARASARRPATAAGRAADDRAHDPRRVRRAARRLKGAAVYVWHCDREGEYSLYSPGVTERELPARRAGVRRRRQGHVHEHLPAAYSGRWPHIHFEVYPSLAEATAAGTKLAPRRSRCPRTPATSSTPPTATSRACRTWPRRRSPPTWCSATGTRLSSPRSPASVAKGMTVALNVGV